MITSDDSNPFIFTTSTSTPPKDEDATEEQDKSASAAPQIVNLADFSSIRPHISFMNLTTKVEIRKGQRFYGTQPDRISETQDLTIRLIEIEDHGFILEVPANACTVGHHLALQVESDPTVPGVPHLNFTATAKVKSREPVSPEKDTIALQLLQFDEYSWVNLCKVFSKRQSDITDFFFSMKGF